RAGAGGMKRIAIPLTVLGVLGVIVLSFIPSSPDARAVAGSASATTYSAGGSGSKALFLLLKSLGLNCGRLRRPSYSQLPTGSVLWVLSPVTFRRTERQDVMQFIRDGGTLVAPSQTIIPILEDAGLGRGVSRRVKGTIATRWGTKLDL